MEPPFDAPGQQPAAESSLAARIFNVFATPSDVFEEVKRSQPAVLNWLAPILICIIARWCFVFTVFSQDSILQQIREQQTKAFEQQVAAGKMTKAQSEQAQQMMEKMGPIIMKAGAAVMMVVVSFFTPFMWAAIVLILAKTLKSDIPYMKAVEMTGLGSMVLALGIVLSLFLALILGRLISGPSLGLLVREFDVLNKGHAALAAVNVIYLWYTALVALALHVLTGISYPKAATAVFAVWLVSRVLFVVSGMGQFVM